jgi:hypothetical protein
MHCGTTRDTFLRSNLEWLGRAVNWAKFSTTAGLGVIHKVRYFSQHKQNKTNKYKKEKNPHIHKSDEFGGCCRDISKKR